MGYSAVPLDLNRHSDSEGRSAKVQNPPDPAIARSRCQWLLRGMKSGSRLQGRTAVVGFEGGPWLLMIGDVGF
jgi:hypothetical protein